MTNPPITCHRCGDSYSADEIDGHTCRPSDEHLFGAIAAAELEIRRAAEAGACYAIEDANPVERRACPTCLRVITPDMRPERICALRGCPANPDGRWQP